MGKELDGLRAMLVSPTYGPPPTSCSKSLRVSMMTASNHGIYWTGDASPDKQGWSSARNMAAQTGVDNSDSTDGIVWVDSDIVLEADSVLKMLVNVLKHRLDFVTGVYHKKAPPYEPVIFGYEDDVDSYLTVEQYPVDPPQLLAIGACGFGFVWTSTKLLKAISEMKDFNPDVGMWFPDTRDMPVGWRGPDGRPGMGEDFSFCDKARRAGYQLYVDTGCLVEHMGDGTAFGRAMYLKWLEENGGHFKPPDRKAWRG